MTAVRTQDRAAAFEVSARAGVGAALALLVLHAANVWGEWRAPAGERIDAAQIGLRFDPNTASAAELALLPRIGEKIAQNIIEFRASAAERPAFRSPADLDRVPRIGPATIELLRPYLRFPEPASGPATRPSPP